MSLDIGTAFSEGVDRTVARNGLLFAVAFAVIALVTSVLYQTLSVALLEALLEAFQGLSPEELNIDQGEYDQAITDLEMQLEMMRETSPLALPLPAGAAAGALLAVALVAEVVSVLAVRVFATDATDAFPAGVGDGIVLATLNGFVGGVVVLGLVAVGLGLFVLPGLFFAVAFYFLRQEVALKNKNFVQAMADSWRLTKGHRLQVFALAAIVVLLSQLGVVAGGAVGFLSTVAGEVVAALVGGVLTAFGAAVVTRAYVQLDADEPAAVDDDPDDADPYDAALGPDDIPE